MSDEIISMEDMSAVFGVTDDMGIHRESVRVELTKEDPGSIERGDGGLIEITLPSSTPTGQFAEKLRGRLEQMGYVGGQGAAVDEEEDEEDDFP